MRIISTLSAAVIVATAPGAAAYAAGDPTAELLACRTIAEASARLACFDQAAGLVAQAPPDQAGAEERRGGLGRFIPQISVHGLGGGDDRAEAPRVAARPAEPGLGLVKVRGAAKGADGKVTLTLDDGAVWRQVDDKVVLRMPQAGAQAEVGKGAFGYYVRLGSTQFWAKRVE